MNLNIYYMRYLKTYEQFELDWNDSDEIAIADIKANSELEENDEEFDPENIGSVINGKRVFGAIKPKEEETTITN